MRTESIQNQTIGLLVPESATAVVDDFNRLLPDDIHLRVGRLYRDARRNARERLFDMGTHLEAKAVELVREPVDVVVFGCTGGSFIGGLGYDVEIADKMASVTDADAVVATTATVDALNALGAKRISVCSPYSGEWAFEQDALYRFYEDTGFDILAIEATEVGQPLTKESAIDIAVRVDRPESEAIFISCTDFDGALEAVDEVEDQLGKPVVTSSQAVFWASMQKLGRSGPWPEGGLLLRAPPPIAT